jgi:hypothetical protein
MSPKLLPSWQKRVIFGKEYRAFTCLYSVSIAGEICHRSDLGVCMVGIGDKRVIMNSAVSMYVHNCKAHFLEREKLCVSSGWSKVFLTEWPTESRCSDEKRCFKLYLLSSWIYVSAKLPLPSGAWYRNFITLWLSNIKPKTINVC